MKIERSSAKICRFLVIAILFSSNAMAQGPVQGSAGFDPHAEHLHAATAGGSFFQDFFKVYTPRRVCMFYEQPVIWLHVISDLLVTLAYFSIPFALIYFIRRRKDMRFGPVAWMFAGFIFACGATHLIGVVDVWVPLYKLDGIVKSFTAVLSVGTAIALWKLMPLALAMPSASQLEATVKQRTAELQKANHDLQEEARARAKDVTERKHAELALAENELKFRQLANTIPQLAWMATADGNLFWYNDRWYEYTGSTFESMQGWGWQKVHDEKELPRIIESWKKSLASGEPFEETFPLRRHDGEFRWHLSRALPLRDSDGRILLWFGTDTDVTEQRQMIQQRDDLLAREREARNSAEHASRMKDEFLATLSHELRTPLNAILGWAQLLRSGLTEKSEVEQGLETIERNARIQIRLIEDLLDISGIISGKLGIDVQTVTPVAFIKAAIASVSPAADAKAIRIETILDPKAGPISGDPNRLQQVIWNLLSNAIKFTPKGGKVQVILERVNSHLEISVADTGEGIPADFLPYVFDRFRQADASMTRNHGGLGLGLAIVKQLVELHGGSVRVKSAGLNLGATFIVVLPLKIALHQTDDEERNHPESSGLVGNGTPSANLTGLNVLVVDDEPDARILLKQILAGVGATVVTAGSALEAMNLIGERRPDILISDIGMPEIDGYELLRRVKALATSSAEKIPAIALTAFARRQDRTRALHAGFLAHLAKPVEPAELIAVIASITGRID